MRLRAAASVASVVLAVLGVALGASSAHAQSSKKKSNKDATPDLMLADFESGDAPAASASTTERVRFDPPPAPEPAPVKPKPRRGRNEPEPEPEPVRPEGEWVLRWSGIGAQSRFQIATPPKDCRAYRALQLRVNVVKPQPGTGLITYLPSNTEYGGKSLTATTTLNTPGWQIIEIPLFRFYAAGKSHWGDVQGLLLAIRGPMEDGVLEFDSVKLIGGDRGEASCTESPEAIVERVFAGRAERAKVLHTKHYIIFTDSKPAGAKFQVALEKIYRFVTTAFGFKDRTEPLIAYIFQNKADYHEFVIREGVLDRSTALASAGVGCAAFYATFYQAPEAPTVVHEATHQLVAALGKCGGGGSWFQEGWAVYCERAFFGKDAAKDYNWRIKLKDYTPLTQLVGIPVLLSGANASRNYAQAGAFFSFLVQGPHGKEFAALRDHCASGERGGEWSITTLEAVYGRPLAQLEEEWAAWTAKRK